MKLWRSCLALAICTLAAGAWAGDAPPPGALQLTNRTADAFEGAFGYAGSLVSFSSRLETPTLARMTLEVNGVFLEASYDAETETLRWDGHNGALTLEAKEALVALSHQLDRLLGKDAKVEMPLHEMLVYRRVLFWAEAPVGLALPARVITKPNVRVGEKPLPGENPQAVACQAGNEDGVLHFSTCGAASRWLVHDATTHCITGESIQAGIGTPECMGRCGPGCWPPLCGWSSYTYDCGDHDRCCRVHGGCTNPWDASCSDEYWEADDDFLARPRCFKCF